MKVEGNGRVRKEKDKTLDGHTRASRLVLELINLCIRSKLWAGNEGGKVAQIPGQCLALQAVDNGGNRGQQPAEQENLIKPAGSELQRMDG